MSLSKFYLNAYCQNNNSKKAHDLILVDLCLAWYDLYVIMYSLKLKIIHLSVLIKLSFFVLNM